MKFLILLPVLLIVLLISCKRPSIVPPPPIDFSNLLTTQMLSPDTMKAMEGIYRFAGGSQALGEQFVCKVSSSRISFSGDKGIYIILQHGYNEKEGAFYFSGFWRNTNSKKQGTVQFKADANAFHSVGNTGMVLNGTVDGDPVTLRFERAFSNVAVNKNFIVLAHRGVQTDTDPPYAENSLNALLHAEDYGVNGMELDVRMTKDNVPICIHDEKINARTLRKPVLSGKWDEYSFREISEKIQLTDGQKVPSLEQALDLFIDSTNLTYLWMDIKGNKDIFKYLEPLVRKAYARAAAKQRNVVLMAGIPSDEVVEEFYAQPGYKELPTLFEQDLDLVIKNGGSFYGPRYSEGLHLDEAAIAHSKGIKMICWTLNKEKVIREYLEEGQFDGFVTDNPAIVLYQFYTLF